MKATLVCLTFIAVYFGNVVVSFPHDLMKPIPFQERGVLKPILKFKKEQRIQVPT